MLTAVIIDCHVMGMAHYSWHRICCGFLTSYYDTTFVRKGPRMRRISYTPALFTNNGWQVGVAWRGMAGPGQYVASKQNKQAKQASAI